MRQRLAAASEENARGEASLPAHSTNGSFDLVLFAIALALTAFGVVMVFSSSSVFASQRYHDPHFFLIRQSIYAGLSLPLMLLVTRMRASFFRKLAAPSLITSLVLLVAVFAIGRRAGGAIRWIQIGPFNIQPAEIAKFSLVLWLADYIARNQDSMHDLRRGWAIPLGVTGAFALLTALEPDLGSAVMLGALALLLLYVGGAKLLPMLSSLTLLGAFSAVFVMTSPWRRARLEAFFDPFAHRQGAGYQVVESLLGFGSGGWFGVGIGDGREKLFFLPDAHTDFIASIIGEEMGFVGIVALVIAFSVLVSRGLRIALRAKTQHETLLATGISAFLGLQAFGNMSVALGLLPNKGMVLPFISYGGSSLLMNAIAVGVLLSIGQGRGEAAKIVPLALGSDRDNQRRVQEKRIRSAPSA